MNLKDISKKRKIAQITNIIKYITKYYTVKMLKGKNITIEIRVSLDYYFDLKSIKGLTDCKKFIHA